MAAPESFLTLAGPGSAEMRIRGSVFLAQAVPVESDELARRELADRQRTYLDATHCCSAWRLRDGTERAHDAGEPAGSAGAPILNAIAAADLVDCAVFVIRYFGGTKLGVGGLIRAYRAVAADALAAAPRSEGVAGVRLRLRYGYGHTGPVMRVLEMVQTYDVEHGLAAHDGNALLEVSVPRADLPRVERFLQEASAGRVTPEPIGQPVLYRGIPEAR